MSMTRNMIALTGVLLIAGAVTTADAAKKKPVDSVRVETTELMQIFDADRNGRISKEEFLAIMGQEFDALNRSKTGQLSPSELGRLPAAIRGAGPDSLSCQRANPPPRCNSPEPAFRGSPLGPR